MPRRLVVGALSVTVTTFGLVAVLILNTMGWSLGPRVAQATVIVSAMLVILAAVNAAFIAWATALDARRPAALLRALGATPAQVTTGLSLAQLGPALAGTLLGIPGSILLFLRGGRLSTPPPCSPLRSWPSSRWWQSGCSPPSRRLPDHAKGWRRSCSPTLPDRRSRHP